MIGIDPKNNGQFYRGGAVRDHFGLPRVGKASIGPKEIKSGGGWKVFVQSSSHNRKVPVGSEILLMTANKASGNGGGVSAAVATKKNSNKTLSTTTSSSAPTASATTTSPVAVAKNQKAKTPPAPLTNSSTTSSSLANTVSGNGGEFLFLMDYAKSSRSTCRMTKQTLGKGHLRFGVMAKSPHFDGMQPNWNSANAYMTKKHKQKKPSGAEEIGGFCDLKSVDMNKVLNWIGGAGPNNSSTTLQALADQSDQIWKIKNATTLKKTALPPKIIKLILEANDLPSKGGTDDLIHRLAALLYHGLPPFGPTQNSLCCGKKRLHYDDITKRYVCHEPNEWGKCEYSQSVQGTTCASPKIPSDVEEEHKDWIKVVTTTVCDVKFTPHPRVYLERVTVSKSDSKTNTSIASSTSTKKRKNPTSVATTAPETKQKLTRKLHLSRACVDPDSNLTSTHFVLDEGYHHLVAPPNKSERFPTDLYDVTLCMTNIQDGTNSKYKLQILIPDTKFGPPSTTPQKSGNGRRKRKIGGSVYLWRVWGRVGGDGGGGNKLEKFPTVDAAKKEFCKLFNKKTGNEWTNRKNFVKKSGKNMFYQMDVCYDFDDDDDDGSNKKRKKGAVCSGDPNSKLPKRVQDVISSIFDVKEAEAALKSLDVDITKMPLGKMTDAQLKDAYRVLTEIDQLLSEEEDADKQNNKKKQQFDANTKAMRDGKLNQLSNQFYTKCPCTHPILIDNKDILHAKIKMVDELLDLQISASVMGDDTTTTKGGGGKKAAVDEAYDKLKTDLIPIDTTSEEWNILDLYVRNSRNATVPGVQGWGTNDWKAKGLRLVDAFRVVRQGEADRFESKKKSIGNRKLLWHGSRIANYGGILGQGLRIAPPEAPKSGYRFGKGIYFADLLGKSANYCRTDGSAEMLVMACDVALGVPFSAVRDTYMEKPKPGTHSTHAIAEIIPDPICDVVLEDGGSGNDVANGKQKDDRTGKVIVPLGCAIANPDVQTMTQRPSCDVNEYIVYDQSQVNIRYLLRLTTNPNTAVSDGPGGNDYKTVQNHPPNYLLPKMNGKYDANDEPKQSSPTSALRLAHHFISNSLEDHTLPSASGLKVLNSRTFVEGLRLTVVKGDIAKSKTAAIVSPSDGRMSLTGQVGRRLSDVAGPGLKSSLDALLTTKGGRTLNVSEAWAVHGCDLPASEIVFVHSPNYSSQANRTVAEMKLKEAVKNVLKLCSERNMETITLPSIGSGQAGYDKGDAARWIIAAIATYLEETTSSSNSSSCQQQQSLREVCFCLYDNESLRAYKQGIASHEIGV